MNWLPTSAEWGKRCCIGEAGRQVVPFSVDLNASTSGADATQFLGHWFDELFGVVWWMVNELWRTKERRRATQRRMDVVVLKVNPNNQKTMLLVKFIFSQLLHCIMVSKRDSLGGRLGFKLFRHLFSIRTRPLANAALMSTPTAHCCWEDERILTLSPPSNADAKK